MGYRLAGLCLSLLLLALPALAEKPDAYTLLVARAESGDTTVNFRDLRFAYLTSEARGRVQFSMTLPGLRQQLTVAAADITSNPRAVQELALQILPLDYIDLTSQRLLREACHRLGEKPCERRRHFVEFGLLGSITASGDGKSCDTAWEVVRSEEEQDVLKILNVTLDHAARVRSAKHTCDEMHVSSGEGRKLVYYFNADAIVAQEVKDKAAVEQGK